MSRGALHALLTLALMLPCSPPLAGLVQDGESLPEPWHRTGPPQAIPLYSVDLDRAVRHGGQATLRIRRIGSDTSAVGTVVAQSFSAEDYRGRRVRLSGYTRVSEVTAWGGLVLRVDGSPAGTPFDNMSDRPLR